MDKKERKGLRKKVAEEKPKLTDTRLLAYMILTFYHHPIQAQLTLDEIYRYISKRFTIDKNKVELLLNDLVIASLITKTTSYKNAQEYKEGKTGKTQYDWSIRHSRDGVEFL